MYIYIKHTEEKRESKSEVKGGGGGGSYDAQSGPPSGTPSYFCRGAPACAWVVRVTRAAGPLRGAAVRERERERKKEREREREGQRYI